MTTAVATNKLSGKWIGWLTSLLGGLFVAWCFYDPSTPKVNLYWFGTIMAIGMFAFDLLPNFVTAVLLLMYYILTGIAAPDVAFVGWTTPIPWLCMCGMLIGVLMEKTRLANRIALFTISRVGTTPIRMYIAFLLAGFIVSAIIPDVITVDILFMAIALVGNTLSAVSFCSPMLLVARFISGLPHGAFFGTATLIAKTLADKGKEAQSVSMMVMGQTVANMLGVPAGTLLAEAMSWRLAFAILAAWALMTIVVVISWVPSIDPIKDAGIKGQFRFLTHPGPWLILLAVFFGNSGIFCWWSYVSPWLQKTGGWSATMVPMLMVLAGLGMVVGGIVGGRLTDLWKAGATAALSHGIALCGLLLVFLLPGNHATTALLTFIIGFALFFNSSPQQLLMVQAGEGGGELIAGAAVQIAFNFGNAIGSIVGGAALTATAMNYHFTGIAGAPISLLAVILLVLYTRRYEARA